MSSLEARSDEMSWLKINRMKMNRLKMSSTLEHRHGTPLDSRGRPQKDSNAPSLTRPQQHVTIHVGKGDARQTFYCHKSFLCHLSPFFNAAFNGRFKEGESQTMSLEDDDPETFGFFYHWTICQDIESRSDLTSSALIKLWIFADKVLCPNLQQHVMCEISKNLKGIQECKDLILEKTSQGSILYELLIHTCVLRWKEDGIIEEWENVPKETLIYLMTRIRAFESLPYISGLRTIEIPLTNNNK